MTQDYNTAITAPSNPTLDGYTFTGWDQVIPTKMPASNLVIKALWIIDTYAITYNLDGGLLNNPVNEYTIETDTIILEKPTKEGFAFMGYFDNALFTGNIITEITLGSISNKTLFAKFERINTWFIDIDEQTSETIIISIYVQGYVDFAGFDFVLTYNSNAITYENSTNPLGAIINTQNSGSITMVFVDALNTKTDETLISKITFNTTSTQSYDIELSIKDMITITKDFDIINVSYHVIPFVVEVVLPKVTLTFTDVEGISLTSYTLDANETITNINYPEAPVIAGYRFTGWSQQIPTQMGVTHITIQAIYEQIQMTLSELSAFDGRNGNKAYIAVSGKIYDVTGNPFWSNGNHNGYQAGQDLTVQLSSSPHGIANVLRQPLVGFLKP
jgi:predicted heme/steroid binding protein